MKVVARAVTIFKKLGWPFGDLYQSLAMSAK
jgi:hypothetical protein